MTNAPRSAVVSGLRSGRFNPVERISLVAEILVTYVQVRWLVRGRDMRTVADELRRSAAPDAREVDVVRRVGFRLAHAVQRTLGPLPFDSRCLMRSLVLLRLLARRDVRATVVVGVLSAPEFRAHAWVEYGGRALLPPLDVERLVEI